jgi:hypothetical protein
MKWVPVVWNREKSDLDLEDGWWHDLDLVLDNFPSLVIKHNYLQEDIPRIRKKETRWEGEEWEFLPLENLGTHEGKFERMNISNLHSVYIGGQ